MRFIYLALAVTICSSALAQKWHPFTSKVGAFSATFPAAPEVKDLERQTPEGFTVKAHLHMMYKEPVTAFVIYNEFETGVNIEDDSTYLTTVIQEMITKVATQPYDAEGPKAKDIVFDGYPGKSVDININDLIGHVKVILRSNRAYIVAAIFPKKQKANLDKFISSFKFLPFEPATFATHEVGKTIKMDLPAKPVFDQSTSDELTEKGGRAAEAFAIQDVNSGDSYSILISPYSKYAQFANDSTWIAEYLSAFKSEDESKNEERDLIVDGRPARELIVKNREHIWTRYLAFVHGDVGYLLLAVLHPKHVRNATTEKIFGSIKFTAPATGDLFSDKSSIILKDLVNADTAISNAAKESFFLVSFTEKNLNEIMGYLEKKYPDDSDAEQSRKHFLFKALSEIESEKSIAFIEKIFPALNKNSSLELEAISVLAKLPTRAALDARIRLIAKHTPKEDMYYHSILGMYTVDSLDQRYFYDKTNYLLKQQPYKLPLYYFMKELLVAKRLKLQDIAMWRPTINADFDREMNTFRKDSTFSNMDDFIQMMKYFEALDKKQIASLTELTTSHYSYLAIQASATLLKQKQNVSTQALTNLAKGYYSRISLFDTFEQEGLLQHFPKAYANQDSLAVAQVYVYLEEDYTEPIGVTIGYQGLEEYDGKKMKFYVVRVTFEDDENIYHGVLGPFDPEKLSTWGELNYIELENAADEDDRQYLLDYIKLSTEVEE